MMHTIDVSQPHPQTFPKIDSAQLDALINKLKDSVPKEERALLVEHLETAHAYFHGAMPAECAFNLELARRAADVLPDKNLRQECVALIDGMLESLARPGGGGTRSHAHPDQLRNHFELAPGRSATAAELAAYFTEDRNSHRFGTFYPTRHLVAVVESFELASMARGRLTNAGFPSDQVLAATGEEFAKFLEGQRAKCGVTGAVMSHISRIFDGNAHYVEDRYLEWSHVGDSFLIAFCPSEAVAWRISAILADLNPLAEYWFNTRFIHSFA
ncbi:MAG TPA: hypothetical protein VGL53_17255 [Bryobacteraceae bacterium]|jgi:hypothetical protein